MDNNNVRNVSINRIPSIVSVADIGDNCSIVRFSYHSVEESYEFLYELLKPIHKEWNGCYPYYDRLHITTDSTNTATSSSVVCNNDSSNNIHVKLLRKYDECQSL